MIEYKNFGLLDFDLLTTLIVDDSDNNCKLYVYNSENRGKVNQILNEFLYADQEDLDEISDWMCDRFRDGDTHFNSTYIPNVVSTNIVNLDGIDTVPMEIIEEYRKKGYEFGPYVLCINIELSKS